tara:strand:+ start:294 stop:1217 length:924 start_codon:yes stop_codon:yes gene_type:complete
LRNKMSDISIKIRELQKVYDGQLEALKGINLDIPKGSFFGLLGPNGAGKTTTIGIMTGLVNLTSGYIKVMGYDVVKNYKESRKLIGLSPQELNFDVFFPIRDVLALNAGYYGLPNKEAYERADVMLEQFGLTEKAKNTARELSGGMKRRVQIAKALVHNPEILILDEPTAGVDIELRHMLWDYLKQINNDGKTIILTTHYIEEAEALCDEVAIINNGKIIEQDAPKNLINMLGNNNIIVRINSHERKPDLSPFNYKIDNDIIEFSTKDPDKDLPKIISKLNENAIEVLAINTTKSSLEEVFVKLTND